MLELAFETDFISSLPNVYFREFTTKSVINTVKFIKNYLNIHGIFVIDSQVVLLLLNLIVLSLRHIHNIA